MRIVQETPEILIVKDANVIDLIIGAVFAIVPVVLFILAFYRGDGAEWVYIAGAMMGAWVIIARRSTTTMIDRAMGSIHIKKRSLLKTENFEYKTGQVSAVCMRMRSRAEKDGTRVHSQLALLVSGNLVMLDDMMWTPNRIEKERAIGRKLATMMNVPFRDAETETASLIQN